MSKTSKDQPAEKPEIKLGSKYECYNCGAKFYDLGQAQPVCPKCGADQQEAEEAEAPVTTQATRRRRREAVSRDGEDELEAAGEDEDDLEEDDLDDEELDEELELEDDDLDDEDEDDD